MNLNAEHAVIDAMLICFGGALGTLLLARRRAVAPWLCGYALEAEAHRYQARGLYGELKRWLAWVGSSFQLGIPALAAWYRGGAAALRSRTARPQAPPDAEECGLS